MDCDQLERDNLLIEYLVGSLEPALETEIDEHLLHCRSCQTALEVMLLVREDLQSRAHIIRSVRSPFRIPFWRIASAAAFVFLLAIGFYEYASRIDHHPNEVTIANPGATNEGPQSSANITGDKKDLNTNAAAKQGDANKPSYGQSGDGTQASRSRQLPSTSDGTSAKSSVTNESAGLSQSASSAPLSQKPPPTSGGTNANSQVTDESAGLSQPASSAPLSQKPLPTRDGTSAKRSVTNEIVCTGEPASSAPLSQKPDSETVARLDGTAHPDMAGVVPTKIKLGTLLPDGTSQVNSLKAMGRQWKEQSQNVISLTIYAGGSMGSEQDLISKMRIGQLQAATISVGGLSAIDPYVGAIQAIPLLYHSLCEMEYVRAKLQPEMEARLAAKGFIVLGWADAGWVHLLSKQPYLHPDDFKHGKIFVTADDANEINLINGLGFHAVPLEWSSTLTSLQTGMIDSVPIAPFYAEASQLDTVAKHLLKINYVALVGATVISKTAWDALTPEQQGILRKTGAAAAKEIQARSRAEADEAITAMKQRSHLEVHDVSPALEEEWRRFCEAVYPRIRGSMVPADVFDTAVALVAEYRRGK